MLQIFDLGRSDRDCHLRSNNYIIIPRKGSSEEKEGVFLASAVVRPFSLLERITILTYMKMLYLPSCVNSSSGEISPLFFVAGKRGIL